MKMKIFMPVSIILTGVKVIENHFFTPRRVYINQKITMIKDLKVSKSVEIKATAEQVWDAMTNPNKIKIYLYGTEAITDWKLGSPIIFQGEYEGTKYKDKGNVLENKFPTLLKYNYWSGFSGTEDQLDNYSIITYEIEALENDAVKLTWTQEGFANEAGQQHSENGLPTMLIQIRDLVVGN